MINKIILLFILSSAVYAVETTTDTSFTAETPSGQDSYGNTLYERSVTIKTNNFKVENFWDNFHESGEGQTNYVSVSKTGRVRITAEATSICKLYPGLDKEGCSGQKPFLINNEALDGVPIGNTITLLFQKDYELSTDTILYSEPNASVFYPLDIDRTQKYYKESTDAKSFFNFFTGMFNTFFSDGGFFGSFFNFSVQDNTGDDAEDIRQRYIANIVSGVDQDHRMQSAITPLSTTTLNTPVSLIDYTENTSTAGSCNFFFFKLSESSPFCELMGAMPFISMFSSSTPATTYEIDTIQSDTENALVSLAGTYAEKTATTYQDGVVYQKQTESTGLISGMMNMMKCMFFGCAEADNVNEPMDSYYAFTEHEAINLNFAVTDSGNRIDSFQNFKLMGIHSLTGNQRACTVKESTWNDKWNEHTFKLGDSDSTTTTETVTIIDQEATYTTCGMFDFLCTPELITPEISHEEVITTVTDIRYSAKYMSETVQSSLGIDTDGDDTLAPSEWLQWCDYMVETTPLEPTTKTVCFFFFMCHEETVLPTLEEDGYEILNYTNVSKRGLLLDLRLIDLSTNDKANSLSYQLINTSN